MSGREINTAELKDIFERPFDGDDDPRIRVAQCLSRAEAVAILEYRGDLVRNLSDPIRDAAQEMADVREALDLALEILGQREPTDSRAVSDEYVAMAAAGTPHHNDKGREIIRARLAALSKAEIPKKEV